MELNLKLFKQISLTILFLILFSGCNREVSRVLPFYTSDLTFTFAQTDYFMPHDLFFSYMNTVRRINPNIPYSSRETLRLLSARNIRSNIIEVNSMWFHSEGMGIVIQISNQRTFNRFHNKFSENPRVSQRDFQRLLRHEYNAYITFNSFSFISQGYINLLEDQFYRGQALQPLSAWNLEFFRSSTFENNMRVFRRWIRRAMWQDLNSTIIFENDTFTIYTFNPANNLPTVNNIRAVVPVEAGSNVFLTRTGKFTFDLEYYNGHDFRTVQNNDGSLDIMFEDEYGLLRGIRVFLTGTTTYISNARRVLPAKGL